MSPKTIVFVFCILLFMAESVTKPNILFIMVDDLGWGNVNWAGHNPENTEIDTPNINELVRNGLQLHRHYVYTVCSPTRASFQTGRLPVHVSIDNTDSIKDPTHGIPTKMTTIASKLKRAGYRTGLVGKWDCGFSTYDKMPLNKGYDTFYGYLDMTIGYFSKTSAGCTNQTHIDLWDNDAPAYKSKSDVGNRFVEFNFLDRVSSLIDSYSETNEPFFLVHSMHLPHSPSEIPKDYLTVYPNDEHLCQEGTGYVYPGFTSATYGTEFKCRSILQSQVNLMDRIIGDIVDKLKAKNLYENTLIVFSTDNGGSLDFDDTAGNNYPLRGGKSNFFEGGIRAASFVSGGFLPRERRGEIETGLMHISDWYTTFCALAGVDYHDYECGADLPKVDGLNMWPLISGEVSDSPRTELIIAPKVLIQNNYKLMVIKQQCFDVRGGVYFPNGSTPREDKSGNSTDHIFQNDCVDCSKHGGCVFDVVNDASEYVDLGHTMPELKWKMNKRLTELSADFWKNLESGTDSCPTDFTLKGIGYCGCWMAKNNYNFFAGPYQDLTPAQINFEQKETILSQYFVYLLPWFIPALFIGVTALIKYYMWCQRVNENKSTDEKLNGTEPISYGSTVL